MNQRIRIARGTTSNIANHTDIVPPAGQPILDTEKRYLYIGDNETPLSGFKNNIENLGICAYNLWMPYDNTDKSIAIGNNRTPIYMNESGRPVACNTDLNASIGSVNKPIYFDKNNGMTALDLTQNISNSATKPLFYDSGNIVQTSNTIGADNKPIWLYNGELKASTATIGSNTTPVWISNGVITTSTSVDAANVNNTIKGKNITDIFEVGSDNQLTGYVKNATNTININGLEIKQDENGVLKIGDVIIPQKKLIADISSSPQSSTVLSGTINAGDTLEIVYGLIVVNNGMWSGLTGALYQKVKLDSNKKLRQPVFNVNTYSIGGSNENVEGLTLNVVSMGFRFSPDTNKLDLIYVPGHTQEIYVSLTDNTFKRSTEDKYKPVIYKVYKIIE